MFNINASEIALALGKLHLLSTMVFSSKKKLADNKNPPKQHFMSLAITLNKCSPIATSSAKGSTQGSFPGNFP